MKPQWQAMAKWAAFAGCLAAASAYAGDGEGRDRFGQHGDRMEKAVAACAGKQAGETVSLTGRDGSSIEAQCTLRPAELVAVPKARLERLERAKAACAGLSEGAAAVLSTADGKNLAAQCKQRHGELVAVPNERPRKREH